MFKVDTDFEGANCRVLKLWENEVHIDVDLRDTIDDWFYWCFRVVGAAGRTLTFRFPSTVRVGYFGAAVSHDYETWHWQYTDRGHEGDSFTYTFAEDEDRVYFAHDILYRPAYFTHFAEARGLAMKTLCNSERGRMVPYVVFGEGMETILLTCRHHACESTGSYVLEGVLDALMKSRVLDIFRVICIPFVDYDGVVDGDQGKNRQGHDHNRDYVPHLPAKYASVRAIRTLEEAYKPRFAFDFHSPWHIGGHNDTVFIPVKHKGQQLDNIQRISRLWERELDGREALPHRVEEDMLPDEEWNTYGAPCFGTYMGQGGAELAFTVETPYFLAGDTMFTPDRARETGRALVRALEEYIQK